MSQHGTIAAEAIERGRSGGAFAAIAVLAGIHDPKDSAETYREAMRTAYWEEKDLSLVIAIAYAGTSRLVAIAGDLDEDKAYEVRSAVKAIAYDLASFSWPGWDEPGITISPTDAAAGLAAARSNLAWAVELGKSDLAVSRAHWMLGAHLLTAGEHQEATEEFEAAATAADRAGADAEVLLSRAFAALTRMAAGSGSEDDLASELEALALVEHGPDFVDQVTTARRVIGV